MHRIRQAVTASVLALSVSATAAHAGCARINEIREAFEPRLGYEIDRARALVKKGMSAPDPSLIREGFDDLALGDVDCRSAYDVARSYVEMIIARNDAATHTRAVTRGGVFRSW